MDNLFKYSRLLIIIPVVALTIAASAYFVFGGFSLLALIARSIAESLGLIASVEPESHVPLAISMVEYVHQLLIGTVLYITALGLYQLFIHDLDVPHWLKIDSTEDLETALVGVTIVVIGVHFMTVIFAGSEVNLLDQGLASGAVIAALGLFLGLRAWADKLHAQTVAIEGQLPSSDRHPIEH